MQAYHTKLFLDEQYLPDKDIELYLRDHFEEIKMAHLFKHLIPADWPGETTIDQLVKTSSGQFIYAATVVRYVKSSRHRPHQRLEVILGLRPPLNDLPFSQLDALYTHILLKVADLPLVLDIITFPILYYRYNISNIEKVLNLEHGDVEVAFSELQSIARIDYDKDSKVGYITLLHKSIEDFLLDKERSKAMYIDPLSRWIENVTRLLRIFSNTSNTCRFKDPSERSQALSLLHHDQQYITDVSHSEIVLDAFAQFPLLHFCESLFTHKRIDCSDFHFLPSFFRLLSCLNSEAGRHSYLFHLYSYFKFFLMQLLDGPYSESHSAHLMFAVSWIIPARIMIRNAHFSAWKTNDYISLLNDQMINIMSEVPQIPQIFLRHSVCADILSRAAIFCLSFICDNDGPRQEASELLWIRTVHRHLRRERPWKWRHQHRQSPPNDQPVVLWDGCYRLVKFRDAIKSPYNESPFTNIHTVRAYIRHRGTGHSFMAPQNWTLYISLLDKLIYLLPRSAPYAQLIGMCSRKSLSSMSMMFPKESKRARHAIAEYLARVESGPR